METGTIISNKAILKKLYISTFFVLCMTELMNSAASTIDAYFIGNFVGSLGIAASGFARPFFSFVSIVSGLLGLGVQLICSGYIGKGQLDKAQKSFSGTLLIGLTVSVLLAVLGYFNSDIIASMYGNGSVTEDVAPMAEAYLRGLFIGTPAMVIFGVLSPIVQIGNGKRLIVASVVLQLITDAAGDALNVFALEGSMYGFGAATAVSYYASVIPLLLYFFRNDPILSLRLSGMPLSDLRDIFKFGWSKAIKRICSTLKPIILNGLSLFLGTSLALSAYSVTNQVRDVLVSYSAGTTGAAVLLGALLFGWGDRDGLRCLSELAMKAVASAAILGGICIIFAGYIAGFFITDSQEVLKMATMSIRCVGIMIPFTTFNGMFISFMQIVKRFRLVNILSYLNRLILVVLTSAVMGAIFGTNGLWWALPVSEIISAVICFLVVRRLTGSFPGSPADLMCLAPDFGFETEDYIEISVWNAKDVTSLLDKVDKFCTDHCVDSRRSYYTQLALEELSMNVIAHGFPKCSGKPVIHIWITYDKGDMKIRIQDNCPGFNVMRYCSELQKSGSERCFGLRIVSRISKSMVYMNMFETNNLMIEI